MVGISFSCGMLVMQSRGKQQRENSPATEIAPESDTQEIAEVGSCAGTNTAMSSPDSGLASVYPAEVPGTRSPASSSAFQTVVDCDSSTPEDEALCLAMLKVLVRTQPERALPVLRSFCSDRKNYSACETALASHEERDARAHAELGLEICQTGSEFGVRQACFDSYLEFKFFAGDKTKALLAARSGCELGNPMLCPHFAVLAVELGVDELDISKSLANYCQHKELGLSNFQNFCEIFYPYNYERWNQALDSESSYYTGEHAERYQTNREVLFTSDL